MDTQGYWDRLLDGAEPTRLDTVRPSPATGGVPTRITLPRPTGVPLYSPADLVTAVGLTLVEHAGTREACFAVRLPGAGPVPVRVRPAYGPTVAAFTASVHAQLDAATDHAPELDGLDVLARCDAMVDLEGGPVAGDAPLAWDARGTLRYDPERVDAGAARSIDATARRLLDLLAAAPAGTPVHALEPPYTVPVVCRIEGRIDVAVFRECLFELIETHEALRTTYPAPDGEPVRVVSPYVVVPWDHFWTDGPDAVTELVDAATRREFALDTGPLMHATLVTWAADRHTLVLAFHRAIVDAAPVHVLLGDVAAAYRRLVEAGTASPDVTRSQAGDHAAGQRGVAAVGAIEAALAHWRLAA